MGVATAPTAAGMSSSTAAMRMSLRIRTMARASFFIHFLPKNIFSPFQRKTTFLVFPIYFIIILSLWVSRDNTSSHHSCDTASKKPLPLGEVALRSNDGEGKPPVRKPLCCEKQCLCPSETVPVPARPRQHPCPLRRFAPALPKGEPLHNKKRDSQVVKSVCPAFCTFLHRTPYQSACAARRESGANHRPLSFL